jgi:predicted HAD superfamily Cof-like phosphohydrolase
MKKQIDQVKEFREKFNLPIDSGMNHCDHRLHEHLVHEELAEMKEATDVVETSDAIIDQMYLLIGYALDLGVADKLEAMFDEVHASNMSKLGEDGNPIYREDGKVLKGPDYFKPNLDKILWTSQS